LSTFDVSLYEPIHPAWTADSTAATADSVIYTADGGPLAPAADATDAGINANIYSVDIFEPVASVWTADSTAITADSNYWTADGGPLEGARDLTDAEVIAATLPGEPGGGYVRRERPALVYGTGFGVLPQLEGEAHGVVILAGDGVGALPELEGEAAGAAGVAGRSAGELVLRATAIGDRGETGVAIAVLKGLSIASEGKIGVHGAGSGMIVKLEGAAIGQHDDDEAAVMAFLLAA